MSDEELQKLSNVGYYPTISLHIGADTYEIEKAYVQGFSIVKEFETLNNPLINLRLLINRETYYKVVESSKDLKVRFKLEKEYVIEGNPSSKKSKCFNKLFSAVVEDARPFLENAKTRAATNDSVMNIGGHVEDATTPGEFSLDLYLYTEDMANNKNICNYVLTNANMTDAAGVVLGEAGYKSILMEPLSNDSSYSQVLLPPYTTTVSLKYLDAQYGFYDTGYIFFADIERTYLISRDKKCKAKEPDEYKKVIVLIGKDDTGNAVKDSSMTDDDKKIHYIKIPPSVVNATNLSMNNNLIYGNQKTLIYPNTGSKVTAKGGDNQGKVIKQMLSNKFNNKFVGPAIESSLNENNNVLTLPIGAVDYTFITPNKEYVVKFEDTKAQKAMGGSYRLTAVVFMFNRADEGAYMISGSMTLVS